MTALRPLALLALLASAPALAGHAIGHAQPQRGAERHFPADFPVLTDSEWGFEIGGFGGTARGDDPGRVPVIFVHGNTTDHADWYPVRDAFRAAGWSDQALWALSHNGLGGNLGQADATPNPEAEAERRRLGHDGQVRITGNRVNIPDLRAFIRAVRAYTGSQRYSVVAHSLGVTLARATIKADPELRRDLHAFVGIAGGNKGTSNCPPGSAGVVMSCDELIQGSDFLAELNGPDGADETWAGAGWMTVYDGTGVDAAFKGEAFHRSPQLKGADNRQFAGLPHNDLRVDPAVVTVYREFLESLEPKRCSRRRSLRSMLLEPACQ